MKTKKGIEENPQLSDSELHNLSNGELHRWPRSLSSRGVDPRQVRSALALRDGLLRLLERKDFDEITVREIAAESGVNNATFFRHHTDKKSFFDHVAQEEIDRLVAVSLPFGHSLEGYIALCEYVARHRVLWAALLTGGAAAAMRERYMRVSRSVASDYRGIKSWLPHDLSVLCSTSLIVETISWWLTLEEGAYSPLEIAELLDRLVNAAVTRSTAPRKRIRARRPE